MQVNSSGRKKIKHERVFASAPLPREITGKI
jgi:hypothetical protein